VPDEEIVVVLHVGSWPFLAMSPVAGKCPYPVLALSCQRASGDSEHVAECGYLVGSPNSGCDLNLTSASELIVPGEGGHRRREKRLDFRRGVPGVYRTTPGIPRTSRRNTFRV